MSENNLPPEVVKIIGDKTIAYANESGYIKQIAIPAFHDGATFAYKTFAAPLRFQVDELIRQAGNAQDTLFKRIEELTEENRHFSAEITWLADKYAISEYTQIIQDRNKEIADLKKHINEIIELKSQATNTEGLFPLLQYITKLSEDGK